MRESEWLYATLRSAAEAIVAADAEGRIRFMNRVAEKLLGCCEAQAIGRQVDETVHLLHPNGKTAALAETEGNEEELLLAGPGGKRTPVIATAKPILNETGGVIGTVLALRDITDRKKTEEQVQQNNRELQQFVHSVSHDLHEPLRTISIYSELIERNLKNPDPDISEYLRFIRQGAERMSALLTDLRAYARVSSPSPQPQAADAQVALQEVMMNLATTMEGCGAAVVHGKLPLVAVQGSHLIQLFQNLISNSIKYRRPDQPPTIRIESLRTGDQWQLSVADNGSGIEPDYISRIFDFCQRGHGSEIPGTGMGLAICRRIVQLYGGRIWVDSKPGEGSTFYFTLPAHSAGEAQAAPSEILETV